MFEDSGSYRDGVDWQVAAGYGHQTGELTSATSAVLVAGTPLPLLPSDTFSLWNRYQLTPGAITQNTDFAPRCCIFISGRPQLRMS